MKILKLSKSPYSKICGIYKDIEVQIFADEGTKNSMFVRNLFLRILIFSLNLRNKILWIFKFLTAIIEIETFGSVIERNAEDK